MQVCCNHTALHELTERDTHPPHKTPLGPDCHPSFDVSGRTALLINSPLLASPYPTHTLACSCLLGLSLV